MKILIKNMTIVALCLAASVLLIGCEKPSSVATVELAQQDDEQVVVEDTASLDAELEIEPLPATMSTKKPTEKPNVSTGVKPAFESNINSLTSGTDQPPMLAQVVTLDPMTLDLGTFSTSEKGTGAATLTNTGEQAVTIERAKASCGCTASDFRNNTVLQPGESTTINITMDGKGAARKLSKNVTFTIAGHPPLRLPVTAETISYVNLDKSPLTIEDDLGIGTITLTAIDDQPFTVTSILPAIAVELPVEAATTHELQLDWQEFWNIVQTTKVTIRLDHPLCREITTSIRLSAEQRQRLNELIKARREGGELPTKSNAPQSADQLARYIKAGRGEQVLQYIQDGLGKFDAVNRDGVALLSVAAEAGDAQTVLGLLELGAMVERVDRVNRTPIMYAARSKNPETIRILLDAGADIQARDRLGNTPLAWASGFGVGSGVQVLIDAGADTNTVDTVLGYTPLIWAAGFGETDSVLILIEAGADVSVNDIAQGRTPLMYAVRTGTAEGVAALLEAGAKVNGIDNVKDTALHIGAGSNNVTLDKIVLLVEAGADVDAKNGEGLTALQLAETRTDDDGPLLAEYLASLNKTE
jgi:ankyrin repeat protein